MGQRVADGVVIDLHVRQQSQQVRLALEGVSQGVDLLAQRIDAGLERGAIGLRNRDPLGRDRPHPVRHVIGGTIRTDQAGHGQRQQSNQPAE